MEQLPENHLHWVQTDEKDQSTDPWFESHERWIGKIFEDRKCIHEEDQPPKIEDWDRQRRSRNMALASGDQGADGSLQDTRRSSNRWQQDFLFDESWCRIHTRRRFPLYHIWVHIANLPRRSTPRRRRRPNQHIFCTFRTVGWKKSIGFEIQEDRGCRPSLHLHDLWVHCQICSTSFSRWTHPGTTDDPIQCLWCSMALWLEQKRILSSDGHKRLRTTRAFRERRKENCNHRSIWQPHW